ncbi:MAG: ParB/RepB/Spo0J family partition protein [Defluviitaleaceae bacterium]|nr:ParB/RepB/Spo0J family partition protein [Defluviitaleaceae bacterium]
MARKGLGKGLGALLSIEEDELTVPEETITNTPAAGVEYIDIRKIEPNRNQPRQFFDDATLAELAESIKSYGIIQPLILKDSGGYYTIIAGERRFRAARLANLESVPGIIKDYSELETLQIALIENIQRQDLTPIEEAACYRRLMDDFFFSQEDIAGKVGKNRNAIGNAVRLLDLDARVQELVSAGRITVSHAKVLLTIKDGDTQFFAAEQIAEEDLSVRLAESLVLTLIQDSEDKEKSRDDDSANKKEENQIRQDVHAAYKEAEDELKTLLGTKVSILQGKKKGKIEIEYYSPEELDRLLGLLKRS